MYRFIDRLAQLFAQLGGIVLSLLIILTCASVLGRTINSILHSDFMQSAMSGLSETLLATGVGPINGDFEIIEAGMAFAIFAFLPLCQLKFAHASVDIFTSRLPDSANRFLRAIIEVVFAAVIVLITVQLFSGMMSKFRSGQTTLLIQFPVWWSYMICLFACVATALTSIYVAAMRVIELKEGRALLPVDSETAH